MSSRMTSNVCCVEQLPDAVGVGRRDDVLERLLQHQLRGQQHFGVVVDDQDVARFERPCSRVKHNSVSDRNTRSARVAPMQLIDRLGNVTLARNLIYPPIEAWTRAIEKKDRSLRRQVVIGALAVLGVLVAWQVLSRAGSSRLAWIRRASRPASCSGLCSASSTPPTARCSLRLPCISMSKKAGASMRSWSKAGSSVEKGELILRFSNATLQRNSIDTETQLLENLDIQRNTAIQPRAERLAAEGNAARPRPPDRRPGAEVPALRGAGEGRQCGDLGRSVRDDAQPAAVPEGQARAAGRAHPPGRDPEREADRAGAEVDREAEHQHGAARPHRQEPGGARAHRGVSLDASMRRWGRTCRAASASGRSICSTGSRCACASTSSTSRAWRSARRTREPRRHELGREGAEDVSRGQGQRVRGGRGVRRPRARLPASAARP